MEHAGQSVVPPVYTRAADNLQGYAGSVPPVNTQKTQLLMDIVSETTGILLTQFSN